MPADLSIDFSGLSLGQVGSKKCKGIGNSADIDRANAGVSSQAASKLLALPSELRLAIYGNFLKKKAQNYLRVRPRVLVSISASCEYQKLAPLLYTCKLLQSEVQDFLYSTVKFHVLVASAATEAVFDAHHKGLHWGENALFAVMRHIRLDCGVSFVCLERACQRLQDLHAVIDMLAKNRNLESFSFTMHLSDLDDALVKDAVMKCDGFKQSSHIGGVAASFQTKRVEHAEDLVGVLRRLLEDIEL